jgi:hypothetical protein
MDGTLSREKARAVMMTKKRDNAAGTKTKAIVVADGIVSALNAKGEQASYARRRMLALASGCQFVISFGGSIGVPARVYQKSGTYRLEIGAWSDSSKKNIQEPRGGFRFDDIADTFVRIVKNRRAMNERAASDQAACEEADAINASVGLHSGSPIYAASNGHGGLVLRSDAQGTHEQIAAVLREAIRVGLVDARHTVKDEAIGSHKRGRQP